MKQNLKSNNNGNNDKKEKANEEKIENEEMIEQTKLISDLEEVMSDELLKMKIAEERTERMLKYFDDCLKLKSVSGHNIDIDNNILGSNNNVGIENSKEYFSEYRLISESLYKKSNILNNKKKNLYLNDEPTRTELLLLHTTTVAQDVDNYKVMLSVYVDECGPTDDYSFLPHLKILANACNLGLVEATEEEKKAVINKNEDNEKSDGDSESENEKSENKYNEKNKLDKKFDNTFSVSKFRSALKTDICPHKN